MISSSLAPLAPFPKVVINTMITIFSSAIHSFHHLFPEADIFSAACSGKTASLSCFVP